MNSSLPTLNPQEISLFSSTLKTLNNTGVGGSLPTMGEKKNKLPFLSEPRDKMRAFFTAKHHCGQLFISATRVNTSEQGAEAIIISLIKVFFIWFFSY